MIQSLFPIAESFIFPFVLVLVRVSAFIGFFPLFSGRQIPLMVKAGLSVSLAFFWFNPLMVSDPSEMNIVSSSLVLIKEFTVGFLLALALGVILIPARIAGAYLTQEIGLNGPAIVDPTQGTSTSALSMMMEALAIILFFSLQGHHLLILCLHHSFKSPMSLLNLPIDELITMFGTIPETGILIIAPVAIFSFILVVALGFLNKAAPTLNLFSVGIPVRVGLGLFCLLLFFPIVISAMQIYMEKSFDDITEAFQFTLGTL